MFQRDKLKLTKLPVSKIQPNPSQPRKLFREDELKSLAQSIQENGLLQPVTVRKENGVYFLVAGERRLRACKIAGLREIPAIVTDCPRRTARCWRCWKICSAGICKCLSRRTL